MSPILLAAAEAGFITMQHAVELDAWANELVTEIKAGRMTEDEMTRAVEKRLEADLAKRGQA